MQLGSINNIRANEPFVQKDFDFTPIESRVKQLEDNQKYLMIALVLLALYTIFNKK